MSEDATVKDRLIESAVCNGAWSVQTRRSDDGWTGLHTEWDDLTARCSAATPFQSYAWLESWWHTYGAPGSLRLILVRYGGRLVAAAPLALRRRAVCPVLTPLGGALSDFTDVVVDDAMAEQASRVLTEAIIREPGWQAVDFPETRSGAVAGATLWHAWPGGRRRAPASLCLDLPAMTIEDLGRSLPKTTRKMVRRQLNQLSRQNLEVREVTADDTSRAVANLLSLHTLQWQGRGVNPDHVSPEFAEHLTRASRNMISSRQAALLEFRIDDRLVASILMVIDPDLVGGYLYGVDPMLRKRVDVNTVMMMAKLKVALRLGCSTVSMLRGTEPHKMKWRPRLAPNRRIVLARPRSARGMAYATGVWVARSTVFAAKQHAPWLRTGRDRVRHAIAVARGGPR